MWLNKFPKKKLRLQKINKSKVKRGEKNQTQFKKENPTKILIGSHVSRRILSNFVSRLVVEADRRITNYSTMDVCDKISTPNKQFLKNL